ncbi:MAG: hypothetical protein NWE89_05245 [Candidatus Bathyarchaeota archaeon]|nr:hypothetical protein [Candidatus Bathyarchaeota archaeon]
MHSKKDEDFLKQRSRDNLVETYWEELHKVIEGNNCVDLLPNGVRRRLRRYGILLKIGSKYPVTQLGREILAKRRATSSSNYVRGMFYG